MTVPYKMYNSVRTKQIISFFPQFPLTFLINFQSLNNYFLNISYAASSEWTLASTVNTVPALVEATSVEENKTSKEAGGWKRDREGDRLIKAVISAMKGLKKIQRQEIAGEEGT